jgi:hypothetical protein
MIKRYHAPYDVHRFIAPPDSGAKVWRYMDFTKFVSLLDTEALFFSRADQLSDTWEGAHTVENLRRRSTMLAQEQIAEQMLGMSEFYRSLRIHTFLSCWHISDVESAAMWKLYVTHNEGIAVQTTFERLTASFEGDENEIFKVYVGKVRYLDYDHGVFRDGNSFVPFFHKRLSFEHEHELRAIIQPIFPGSGPLTAAEPFADGLLIPVNLKQLIESIYVAPTSERWFADLVESMARKYGIDASVRHSDLIRDALY